MTFSPYYLIIALGCFTGAVLMFTRFRDQAAVTTPAGILFALAGVYILCREFISGFAESAVASWAARGVLVVFLIYLLLCWNNLKAERSAEFDAASAETHEKAAHEEPEEPAEHDE